MRIQQSTIDEIIEKADIVEVIGEYVKLEKKGNDYKGLCPFHNDSNPSLSVSPAKKIYKCFSCNEAGNAVRFIEKIKNVNYIEALKILADKYNVKMDIKENPLFEKFKKGYSIMKEATNVYEFYLKNTIEGKEALEYLYNRNLSDDIIKRFNIGLSSRKDNIICKTMLESNNYLPLDLMEVKLVDRNNNGKYYDLFNSRIMFPIKDLNGNFIGFSGRIFPKGDPKYINSVDNYIFKKGNILYNYSDAVNDIKIKNNVYLFEGFMDVIAAYRCGITNAVASMGTSLTVNQIKALKKVTDNIVVCFDSDGPGVEATKRAIKLLLSEGLNVSCIYMTETKDADEYINKYGSDGLRDYFENKKISSVDYFYLTAKEKLNINDPNSVINFQKEIYNTIHTFNNKTFEAYLLKKMSNELDINYNDLQDDLSKYSPSEIDQIKIVNKSDLDKQEMIYDDYGYIPEDNFEYQYIDNTFDYPNDNDYKNINLNKYKKDKYLTAEKALLYLAYNEKNDCLHIRNKLGFKSYVSKINRGILYKLYDYYALSDTMNSQDFFKKLDELEFNELNTIINSQNIFLNEEIDSLIDTVLSYQFEKDNEQLKEKISKSNHLDEEDLKKLLENKKRMVVIKK